jgi:riboflavin synthase
MAPETVERTTFKHLTVGAGVNIERALRLSDRIDGHLVSGHIDGTGTIASLVRKSNALIVRIEVPPKLAKDLIEKGSVAVEGISLTINHCTDTGFEVSIIPHTADITTIGQKKVGDEVNIETDMIGKYVKKILLRKTSSKNDAPAESKEGISMALLARNGFL